MIGSKLGPYRIESELGSGGMGRVYAATVRGRCPGLAEGMRVALKVVHPHLLETPGFFKRFLREGEIGKSVHNENVVRTFDCDQLTIGGKHFSFLVMEYVEGQTLRDLLAELERVPEELCRHVGREVCKGLSAIHAAGAIHRDMKPDNVLITAEHIVKVMDLGVARLTDEALRLSQTGTFAGSLHYAAPECFRGAGAVVDYRADLHALGLVLYELSCGINPYYAEALPAILKRVLHEEPRRLGDINPQLSPFFEEVVHCLLEKQPEDRFASANELLEVLEDGEDSDWWHARARSIQATSQRPIRRIRIPRETAVYGRDDELAKLRELCSRAQAGEGQVLLLEGEAGIGKSRLVDELIGRLHTEGVDLNFLFASYPPGGAATASGAFSSAFREHLGEEGSAPYLSQTPILVPAFDALLRGESAPRGVEQLTKDSLQTCFVNVTRSLAAERLTVVLIDDLHFAPDEGRALFMSLAMALPGHRVVLVGTTRRGGSGNWLTGLTRLQQTTQMVLGRLGPRDLAQLLADSFHSEKLAQALAMQIALKSDGNPFFAFEIIRGLREGQFITQTEDGMWISTRVIEEIQIPSSILDLVNARVADLTEEERDLLDVACCWGYEFDPGLVAEALGIPLLPALKRFGQIERQHRLVRAGGRRYTFDHHQVQEALYGSIFEQVREVYHAALADALERRTKSDDTDPEWLDGALCVDLCDHFLKGAQGERALPYLESAQAHLTKGYMHAHVVSLTERALAVPELLAGTARAQALLRLAGALNLMGRRDREEQCAREAQRLAEDDGDQDLCGQAATKLGQCLYQTGRPDDAEAAYRRALDIAIDRYDLNAEAGATVSLGLVYASQGRFDLAQEYYERGLGVCRATGDQSAEAVALGNFGNTLRAAGRLPEARAHYERSLEISHAAGNRQGEAIATGNLGTVFQSEGRLSEAREYHERHLALSREIGFRAGEAIAYHNLGNVLGVEGDAARAGECLVHCLSLSNEIGYRRLEVATHLALAALRSAAGDEDAERVSLASARDVAAAIGAAGDETLARCRLACLPGGDAADAVAAFTANDERLYADERLEARWLLFRATGDREHLGAAKELLDASVADKDAATRESMLTNLRINRDIVAACKELGM